MAFKREADSSDWLSLLKKRRITELFAENIPEDEALLMKNGRFCCTVCSHRPIFDTAQMLAHNRLGKKHAFATEKHLDNKLEVRELIQKRQHEHCMKGKELPATSTTSEMKSGHQHHPLLTAQRYEPTVKKVKLKRGERRPVLQLDEALGGARTIVEYQRQRNLLTYTEQPTTVKVYKSKRQQYPNASTNSDKHTKPKYYDDNDEDFKNILTDEARRKDQINSTSECSCKPVDYVHPQNSGNKSKLKSKAIEHKNPLTEAEMQRRKTAELYLQARGAGWKKGLDGSWIRDEDVEFDSDEEPPDIP